MKLRLLSAADLRGLLTMEEAVDAVEEGFVRLVAGEVSAPTRIGVEGPAEGGVTLLMGAAAPSLGLATKVVSVFPDNARRGLPVIHGLVLVLDPLSGEPRALVDGSFLTAWRTGAASGAATRLLARPDARVGALIGCGRQAETQLLAIDTVRQFEVVRVFARDPERVRAFCEQQQGAVRARLQPADSAEAAVEGADVVCTATTSHSPVFDGAALAPGVHLNGVGSFTLDMREVDETTVSRSRIFIDELEAALAEAGELVAAERAGVTRREDWTPLGLVAAGRAPGRADPQELTFFKSVGHAVQDVATATRALRAAEERGVGREVEL